MFDFPHILTRPWAALRRASSRPLLLPLASLCLGASSPALAQGPVLAQDRGSATGLASIEGLGLAVATNGAVGAVSDLQGRVHVYDLSTPSPILLETLLGPRGVDFGFALDWQGDRLAVGAPRGGPDGSGAVYLYRRGGAGLLEATQAIVAPVADQTPETRFGHRLRFKDQRLAVGAPGAAEGRVYVFDSSGELYVRTQSLQASDGLPGDRFGAALDWKLDCMVIGAPSATVNASTPGQGVLYVFREGSATLMEEVKLSATVPPRTRALARPWGPMGCLWWGERLRRWSPIGLLAGAMFSSTGFRAGRRSACWDRPLLGLATSLLPP